MVRSSLFYLLDKIHLVPLVDLHISVDTLDIFVEDKENSKPAASEASLDPLSFEGAPKTWRLNAIGDLIDNNPTIYIKSYGVKIYRYPYPTYHRV